MTAAITVVHTGNHELDRFCESVKQNLDVITGQTSNSDKLVALGKETTPLQLVNLVNLLAKRIGLDKVTPLQELINFTLNSADGSVSGFKNRIINGGMAIDQRNAGASHTITAAAALAYTVDRFYAYCTGANVTGQRVAGTAPNRYNYQFTGAASVTKIGFAQRIEAANCQDLAGQTATFAVDLANSLLTTVTWTAWRANTNDTFGTLASPTRTQIGTGTFTVSSTLTRYNAVINVPSAATTGIEIELSVGAQTSGTWTIGRMQFELGSVATPFEVRPFGMELALCQRYYQTSYVGAAVGAISSVGQVGWLAQSTGNYNGVYVGFQTQMRTDPTTQLYNPVTGASASIRNIDAATNLTGGIGSTRANGAFFVVNNVASTYSNFLALHFTAAAEL